MDNKKVLFQKTINIQIFDQQLPTKIYDVINTKKIKIDENWLYYFDVRFPKSTYHNKDFFKYKIEKKKLATHEQQGQIEKPSISDIVNQILHKIVLQVENCGIALDGAAIIGTDKIKNDKIKFIFYKSKLKSKEKKTEKTKKVLMSVPDLEGMQKKLQNYWFL